VSTVATTQAPPSNRVKPSVGLPPGWWPVALAGELGRPPKAFRLGTRDLAVYRDLQGVVRAVDDTCPHRRLPLSMGRITEDGYLQCAYHGWCFDGADGRCTRIPNLQEDEKIPGAIRLDAFATVENIAEVLGFGLRINRLAPAVGPPTGEEPEDGGTTMFESLLEGGLVLVWTGDEAPPEMSPSTSSSPAPRSRSFSGRVEVRAPHERVAAAVLHNPGRALALGALLGSGDQLSAPEVQEDTTAITVRRERLRFELPAPHTFDPFLKTYVATEIRMVATTGLCWIEAPGVRIVAGLTPVGTYRTILRWRGEATGAARHAARLLSAFITRRGQTTSRAEALADDAFEAPDPAVQRLQDLRAREAEQAIADDHDPKEQS
jgi:phenylpropionate dioxygenase-like ring-hydroxylating dioxygenase large terminal subunit